MLGKDPQPIDCPWCHERSNTRVQEQASQKQTQVIPLHLPRGRRKVNPQLTRISHCLQYRRCNHLPRRLPVPGLSPLHPPLVRLHRVLLRQVRGQGRGEAPGRECRGLQPAGVAGCADAAAGAHDDASSMRPMEKIVMLGTMGAWA